MTLQEIVVMTVGGMATAVGGALIKYIKDVIKHIGSLQEDIRTVKSDITRIADVSDKRMTQLEYYVHYLLDKTGYKETPYEKTFAST